uniref:Polygalacturonase-inhibiting protein n=1 Tax=Panax notoginseng TaxID=44586 RepID=A0A192IBY6_9APIA|nr:polygalacturonase-inhibiting protein [Panax notoginseng]
MLLLLFLIYGLSPVNPCHPNDLSAILHFKNSFSNSDLLSEWSSDMNCCHIFTCENNRIIEFTLDIYDLSGSLKPDALAGLTYLKRLRLHKMPFLIGEIPPAIENLTHLTYLEITWTNISGPIPQNLANLINLNTLDFSFNKLYGSIPLSLLTLPNIFSIDLSRNQLTGPIPESYGQIPNTHNLLVLILSHNKLSGKLPASLGSMNFSRIDLSRNNLSDDASMLFGATKGCQVLDISRNNFEFDFSRVEFMDESLQILDISHNKIYGKIPQLITEASMLQGLNFSYNRLCGEIPNGWKLRYRSEGFDNSSFSHNRCLCGAPLDPWKF